MMGSNTGAMSLARRKRLLRSYRSPGPAMPRPSASGGFARGQGANNFQYGPPRRASVSVLTLHKHAARPRRSYSTVPDYASMNRDELRVAAKAAGVEGWHKMNKAALLASLGVTA